MTTQLVFKQRLINVLAVLYSVFPMLALGMMVFAYQDTQLIYKLLFLVFSLTPFIVLALLGYLIGIGFKVWHK